MNLIEMCVTEVLSKPYQLAGSYWNVDVLADGYGHISETTVYCKTLEEAEAVSVGYEFLS